jgi:CRISPR/Cas system-associated endonuclease/helicase Cas3
MKVTTKVKGCSIQAQQAIMNKGYKPEEYISNGRRVFVVVNTRNGARISSLPTEKSFDDLCKRLGWL